MIKAHFLCTLEILDGGDDLHQSSENFVPRVRSYWDFAELLLKACEVCFQ